MPVAVVLLLVVGIASAALAAPASAGKYVDRVLAGGTSSGTAQGLFNTPRGVAINFPTVADGAVDPLGASVDGYVYVVDQTNHRIQVFGADGSFKFAWGRGVQTGADGAETCDSSEVPCVAGVADDEEGEFDDPQGIAINQQTGDVYIRERDNRRVQQFTASGAFVRTWGWDVATAASPQNTGTGFEICASLCKTGVTGANGGQFATPTGAAANATGIAVDPVAPHNVFVADPQNRRVQEFESDGDLVRLWGWDVATGAPVEFEFCASTAVGVCKAGANSTPANSNGAFGTGNPLHLAIDGASGVLFASDTAVANRVQRFDTDELLAFDLLDPEIAIGAPLLAGATGGMTVDPATSNVLIARGNAAIQELDTSSEPPTEADQHIQGSGLTPLAIALDPGSGNLYFSSTTGGHRVFVADDDGAPPAIATVQPASEVDSSTATLHAEVNSNGPFATNYRLEVSRNGITWTSVAAGQIPGGNTDVPITAEATGLEPNTLYRVRVVTQKEFANPDVASGELTFVTDAVAPSIASASADSISDTTARLTGRINPHSTPTSYRFEYGVGNFTNVVPVPDAPIGSGPDFVFVDEQLSGLQPSTTYQFRLVVTSATEGSTTSGTGMFTTTAVASGESRGFELVSPADKVGGVGVGTWYTGPGDLGSAGASAYDGERFAAAGSLGSVLMDGAQAFAGDWAFADRISDQFGWRSHSPVTHASLARQFATFIHFHAASDDLSTVTYRGNRNLLRPFGEMSTWIDAEVGDLTFIGDWEGAWQPLVTDPDQVRALDTNGLPRMETAVADDGSAVVASGELGGLAGPGDPTSPSFPDLVTGRSVYLEQVSDGLTDTFDASSPELVNVCTTGTQIPSVSGSSDLEAQGCAAPEPLRDARLISDRGATTRPEAPFEPGASTTLENVVSADGSRVFFLSPDPLASGVPDGMSSFCSGSGTSTVCPPQLFVRQDDGEGNVVTRWISRAEDGLFGTQDASLTGAVRFEGASDDGDKVFFRTNSPLTTDDPNGTGSAPVTTGSASGSSWDLYVYDMPNGSDGDPATPDADPAGGTLTRVSRGPSDSDCNVTAGSHTAGALRSVSADGARGVFTCAAPLAGATAPSNGITIPSGTAATTVTTNLYEYDARAGGEDWTFVAQIPRSLTTDTGGACASTGAVSTTPLGLAGNGGSGQLGFTPGVAANCVRGTSDGSFVTFWTPGRLTADDPNAVSQDIYAYDGDSQELTRITASQGGVGAPYPCGDAGSAAALQCYGDGGLDYRDTAQRTAKPILGMATDPSDPGDRTAFFQSRSRLVAQDTDDSYDVYQWHNGALTLLSTGSSDTDGAFYKGNDSDGRNVYFATMDQLTWQDHDAVMDIYTARTDGGIPQPPPPVVCGVLVGGCQTGDSGVSSGQTVVSDGAGSGNAGSGERATLSLVGLSAAQRKRAARSGLIPIKVRTTATGVVRVVGRAKVGGRQRVVGRASTSVRGTGKTVRLRLSQQARKALRSRRSLAVTVTVRATDAFPRTATIRLRRAGR